jgi:serine/threonine protein kinase
MRFLLCFAVQVSNPGSAPVKPTEAMVSEKRESQQHDLISLVNFENQGDFREGEVIGEGGFGLVSKVIHRKTRLVFACKTMIYSPERAEKIKSFLSIIMDGHQEIESHRAVQHPNIVRCFGGWIQQTGTEGGEYDVTQGALICKFSIILEFMAGGTLSGVILKRSTLPASIELHRWIFQIALGLKAIHDRGFAHFDLKPDNILLTGELNAKIADLGGMVAAGDQCVGTSVFAAPEIFEQSGPAYDMFALGLIIVCCSLRLTVGDDFLAVSVAEKCVGEMMKGDPKFDLRKEPGLQDFFHNRTMASVLVENLVVYDPEQRFSAQKCLEEMAKVAPDQFTVASNGNLIDSQAENENEKLVLLTSEYSNDKFEEIIEPVDPMSWIRIIVFSIFLLAAFIAVLTQFSIASSNAQIPPLVGGYLIMSMVLSTIFGIMAGPILIYNMSGKISTYMSFFVVYFVDIILSIVLASTFSRRGEQARLALAVIYTMSKIIAAYIPLKYIKLTCGLICGIIHSVKFLFKKDFRSVWAVVFITLALQICILFLGIPYVVEPWLLPSGSTGNKIFAAFVNLYVFLWLLNLPRYCLHYLCVSLYRNSFSQIKSTSPLLIAAYDCVVDSGLGILVVSLFSVISPVCSFAVSFFTSLMWVSGAIAAGCGTCASVDDERDEHNCCNMVCCLAACGSAAVGAASFFMVKVTKWLLTYVTKLNLTTMVILKVGYWKASKLTAFNKKITKLMEGSASLVTENIISAHISNICVLIGGLMFVIVDQIVPATAFYALITGYVIARTMFEPVDAWVLTGYAVFDYMRELLPAMTGSLELQHEFEAIRNLAHGNNGADEIKNEATEIDPPEPDPAECSGGKCSLFLGLSSPKKTASHFADALLEMALSHCAMTCISVYFFQEQ